MSLKSRFFAVLIVTGLLVSARGGLPPRPTTHASHQIALADLPPAAQTLVAASLGHDDAAYQFQPAADGFRAANADNTWQAAFSNAGLRLTADDTHWTFALQGVGYGEALHAVSAVAPTANANRLEYAHDGLTEWYVNGPAGLEQGWTLASPPDMRHSERSAPLTLALAVEGNMRVEASGSSMALLNDDGTVALNYTGLVAYDATGRPLPAWFEMDNRQAATNFQIRVDDTAAQYPLTIDPYVLKAVLTNSFGSMASDQLGYSVAMSADGSIIVAGAMGVNNGKGAVYVFVRSPGGWTTSGLYSAALTNANGATNDRLGISVAISADGSTIVAGAQAVSLNTGAAYVFVKPGATWLSTGTPNAILTNAGGSTNDYLGASVAINANGSTIVAGAGGVSGGRGATYVFIKAGSWATTSTPTAVLTNAGGSESVYLGDSVAISADGAIIGIGARGTNGGRGTTYVFVKGGSWATTGTPTAVLTNADGAYGDDLGWSVAISADGLTIVAGAPGVSSDRGAAYVFVTAGSWATTGTPNAILTNTSGVSNDRLGIRVEVNANGSTVVAGANGVSGDRGAVDVFTKPSGGWTTDSTPDAILTNAGGAVGDVLGQRVAVSADGVTIVAGASGVNSDKGAVNVFIQPTNHANLSHLVLSSGTLDPLFASGTTAYTANVANNVTSITVTPMTSDSNATVRVNGTLVASGKASGAIPLTIGANPITVRVTASDGTTIKTYTVTVTRAFELYLPLIQH